MSDNSFQSQIKNTYLSLEKGIMDLETLLPQVANEDLNYDLNRQLQDYHKLASMWKQELTGEGSTSFSLHESGANEPSSLGCEKTTPDHDKAIAQYLIQEISSRLDLVQKYKDDFSSVTVNSRAREMIEEEENHMSWMRSYMKE